MTTIGIVIVVALVFFVAICIAAFVIWKRETEMRTDSMKVIGDNLEKLRKLMEKDLTAQRRNSGRTVDELLNGLPTMQTSPSQTSAEAESKAETERKAEPGFNSGTAAGFNPGFEPGTEPDVESAATFSANPDPGAAGMGIQDSRQAAVGQVEAQNPQSVKYAGTDHEPREPYVPYINEAMDEAEETYDEISLDFITEDSAAEDPVAKEQYAPKQNALYRGEFREVQMGDPSPGQPAKTPMSYNTSRSGKTYTVSELEMLIKE